MARGHKYNGVIEQNRLIRIFRNNWKVLRGYQLVIKVFISLLLMQLVANCYLYANKYKFSLLVNYLEDSMDNLEGWFMI